MSGTILFSKESLAAYNKSYEIDVGGNLNNPLAISEDEGGAIFRDGPIVQRLNTVIQEKFAKIILLGCQNSSLVCI